jgi:hypothetical protein
MIRKVTISKSAENSGLKNKNSSLNGIFARRRMSDLAKSQAQDIAILRDELERLRLRTYPAFAD